MPPERGISEQDYLAFKNRVLTDLIQQLDSKFLDASDAANLRLRVEAMVEQKIHEDKLPYSRSVRMALVTEIADELLGFGPIESALRDPTVSEVAVSFVYGERAEDGLCRAQRQTGVDEDPVPGRQPRAADH